jgi:hypothetical protein
MTAAIASFGLTLVPQITDVPIFWLCIDFVAYFQDQLPVFACEVLIGRFDCSAIISTYDLPERVRSTYQRSRQMGLALLETCLANRSSDEIH